MSALRIVRAHPEKFQVKALAVRTNVRTLVKQALEFRPEVVCVFDEEKASQAEKKLRPEKIRVVTGIDGLREVSRVKGADQVLFAVVGAVGLIPIFEALKARKSVAIANKEPLVMAGELLVREARRLRVPVLPVDSEHSGLWQCLESAQGKSVKRLILTSSGGPFRQRRESFDTITLKEALKHPKWKMGPKITIDSATMMNKGLEVIEAANLFEVPADKVDVLVHPEAIIHALVEVVDGSHVAHLGVTDMRLPIQYALSYPERLVNHLPQLDLIKLGAFHFEKPDLKKFPCLALGYEASRMGGTMPSVLNAANEVAVQAFLDGKIEFTQIPRKIRKVMKRHTSIQQPDLDQILQADRWARDEAEAFL